MDKLKFALYWGASCGGCEVAVLDINEKILDVVDIADIVLWPVALDFKYHHIEEMANQSIDVCLFNGAVRNSEVEEIARLLRDKSKVMAAFGSCACFGGIPGLANLTNRQEIFEKAYQRTPSTENPEGIRPEPFFDMPEGTLTIPEFYDTVYALGQVVEVDYFLPGCPPTSEQIIATVEAIAKGKLPPPGSIIAGEKTLCDQCERQKEEKKITEIKRIHEIMADSQKCFLEQGVICCGPATRGGCGAQCINANLPCRGCFGPAEGISDLGAKLLSAVASIFEAKSPEEIQQMVTSITDPVGTFYRFGLPTSLLRGARMKEVSIA